MISGIRTNRINVRLKIVILAIALWAAAVWLTGPAYAIETNGYDESEFIPVGVKNTECILNDINGETVSTLANGKPKILFFFNTTCPRCKTVEENIQKYGLDTDAVDFVMAESSNGGVSEETARSFYEKLGIDCTARCYGARDACWYYLRRCGYVEDSTKKPIIIYISEDNEIIGFTWNYTNIYRITKELGIKLEPGEHQWEDFYNSNEETGIVKCCERCAVCELERTRVIDIPKPAKTKLAYTGKSQRVLDNIQGYTVIGGRETAVGEYKAVVYLDDPEGSKWSDGTTGHKVIKWSIEKRQQKPVITTSSKTVKYASLKRQALSFKLKVSGAQGKTSFTKKSGSSRLKLSTGGKVTVKKGTPKGTYQMKAYVSAAQSSLYKAGTSEVKIITVKVK